LLTPLRLKPFTVIMNSGKVCDKKPSHDELEYAEYAYRSKRIVILSR
jgi:hypothetical protein